MLPYNNTVRDNTNNIYSYNPKSQKYLPTRPINYKHETNAHVFHAYNYDI